MALKNFTQFTPRTALSATDYLVGYRDLDEIRTDLDSMSLGVSAQLISKGFLPGTIVGSVKRTSYQYTIVPGSNLNAVSGNDNNGRLLSYTVGQIEVYRNGSHLVDSQDYIASNTTQIRNLSTLNFGDIVEVVALSGTGATLQTSLTGFIGNLVQQNFRYTVATGNTITPGSTIISGPDDFGARLLFSTNCFQVYLNGSHLVKDYDYSSYNLGNSLTLAAPVAAGDSVVVLSLSACFASSLNTVSAFSGISRLNAGDRVTLSRNTGNVTVSSQTCISDFPAADWTNGSHIAQWGTLQSYLSGVAASNTSNAAYVEYYGNFSFAGTSIYEAGVVAPNGKIYFSPNQGATVGVIIDPSNNSISTYGTFPGAQANLGCVLVPSGRIYFVSYSQSVGRIVDPSNNTITTYGGFPPAAAGGSYHAGVVAANGRIYCDPHYATVGAIVDPSNNTVTTYGSFPGGGAYHGAVLAPNGLVYFVPHNATQGRIVDPSNNTVTTYGSFPGNAAYLSGVLAMNGKIYFSPHNATVGAIIDPLTSGGTSVQFYGNFPGNGAFHGSVLAPNGKIFLSTYNSTVGIFIDPNNNTTTTYGRFPGSQAYMGNVLAPNGKIYFVPHAATSGAVVTVLNNNNFDLNVVTNPFFNKY